MSSPRQGKKRSQATTEAERAAPGQLTDSNPQASVQPRRVRKAKWVGRATRTEPEAQISPQPCEFNGRAAPSSQPFGLGPAPLQRYQG